MKRPTHTSLQKNATSSAPSEKLPYRDILLAVLGISPAILTETLWCLAHEDPPILPERILVITTLQGRESLRRTLFDQGVF
jgi:hypothetical protein